MSYYLSLNLYDFIKCSLVYLFYFSMDLFSQFLSNMQNYLFVYYSVVA